MCLGACDFAVTPTLSYINDLYRGAASQSASSGKQAAPSASAPAALAADQVSSLQQDSCLRGSHVLTLCIPLLQQATPRTLGLHAVERVYLCWVIRDESVSVLFVVCDLVLTLRCLMCSTMRCLRSSLPKLSAWPRKVQFSSLSFVLPRVAPDLGAELIHRDSAWQAACLALSSKCT